MRFFCDQNIMLETVEFLRRAGHDVVGTCDVGLAEALDDEVLAFAINNERVLLTFDADFGDIRLFPIGTHAGIIRLRMADQVAEILHPVLEHALASLADRDLSGKLVTVARTTIRIRGQA